MRRRTVVRPQSAAEDIDSARVVTVREALPDQEHGERRVRLVVRPDSDVDRHVAFSLVRCVLSVASLLLVLTDIPRTGLNMGIEDFYPVVSPGMGIFFGPYAYPVNTIHAPAAPGDSFTGTKGSAPITTAGLWSYKYDTLSIQARGFAELLNVTSYPPCVLYREPCGSWELELGVVFTMVDDLVSAVQRRFFARATERRPAVIITKNNWIDRLHHIIVRPLWRNQDHRLHMAHHFRLGRVNGSSSDGNSSSSSSSARNDAEASPSPLIDFCPPSQATADRNSPRPRQSLFCNLVAQFYCEVPVDGQTKTMSIQEHMNVRLREYRQRLRSADVGALELDFTVFITRNWHVSRHSALFPKISMSTESTEVTTILRGRRCGADGACETAFIDDYRYERGTSESDERDWRMVTGGLRAVAQGYVWLRVTLLWWGCLLARSREPKFRHARLLERLRATETTFFKIPSYAIVYGSWLPIACYAIAHYIDGSVIHLVGEYVWSSVNGSFQFDPVRFLLVASVQMRNIWFIALLWRVFVLSYTQVLAPRRHPWHPEEGIKAVRGMLIGLTSWLTIFSFLRILGARDTSIIRVDELPREGSFWYRQSLENPGEYGSQLDLKIAGTSLLLVGAVLAGLQLGIYCGLRVRVNFFVCQAHYIPLGADVLWPRSVLSIFWFVRWSQPWGEWQQLRAGQDKGPAANATDTRTHRDKPPSFPPRPRFTCETCRVYPWFLSWPVAHGCHAHEAITRVDKRRPEMWALIRLMNIAFMSDPLVLVGLYITGRPLFLYRSAVAANDRQQRHFLVPRLLDSEEAPGRTATARMATLQLIAIVDSSSVPWYAIVDVG